MMQALEITSNYVYLTQRAGLAWLEKAVNALDISFAPHDTETNTFPEADEPDCRINHLKGELFSTLTHELRTPLTSIQTFSEILHSNPDLDPAQRGQFLDIILAESEKLSGVVSQILDLADIEAGNDLWNPAEINLKEVIEESLNNLRPLLMQQQVELQLRLPDQVPPIIADRRRITQVMDNLFSNAVQFCDITAGWVGVRLRIIEDALQVEVSDNGPGLGPLTHSSSMHRCEQVTDTQAEEPQLTNMNFLISRYIVARSGGKLWAERTANHGARIFLSLPFKANPDRVGPSF